MKNNERFMPKYMTEVKDKKTGKTKLKVISPKDLFKKLKELGAGKFIRVTRSWIDLRTGLFTEPENFKVGLTSPAEGEKPLIEFQVYSVNEFTKEMKWVTRGTVAQSSFEAGRDCIGCEGVRYTKQKHLEIKKQLLLNSPNYKNSRIGKMFEYIKRS
jgi:hypothetical protein